MAHPKTLFKHKVRCIDYQLDVGDPSKKRGGQVVCRLQIVEGPGAGETRMWYGNLHEQSQTYTIRGLRALGMTNDDITAPIGLGTRKAIAVERENLWKDPITGEPSKNKSRIDFIDPIQVDRVKVNNPVTDKNAASVASKFKALFKSVPRGYSPNPPRCTRGAKRSRGRTPRQSVWLAAGPLYGTKMPSGH